MNSDLTPAVIAAGGGTAMLAGIAAIEHKRYSQMRRSRVRLRLRFPASLEPVRAFAALDALSGLPHTNELVFEVTAHGGSIEHFLWAPAAVRRSVESTLTGVIGSLRISEAEAALDGSAMLGLRLFLPTPIVLVSEGAVEASRALLSGLAALKAGEQIVIRWALAPGAAWPRRESADPDQQEREVMRAWRRKTASPGFSVAGLVLIRTTSVGRARELASHIESVVRSRRGPAGQIRITSGRGNRRLSSLPRTTRTSGWLSSSELLPLLAFPLGSELIPGVEVGTARELLVPKDVPRDGCRLFIGRDAFGERPVALSTEASRHHLLVAGGSGTGKSTMLGSSSLSHIRGGVAGVVIDPKADLFQTILDRIPPEHADRIVVFDPGDKTRAMPGLAALRGGDPDFRADVLVGALRSAFPAEAWGVRTDFYLRLAIRTLSEVPDATLVDIGRLFFDERYLRTALTRLSDPFLVAAWQGYLALSTAARVEHVQAPTNRIMALLSRPLLRQLLASPKPLDIAKLFAERKFILANLAPGVLGESAAGIVGAVLMHSIWSAIESRATIAPERRHLIAVYLDELATLTGGTPFGFELLAERARGLGAGLTLAVQTLGRVPEPARGALLGNVASFVTFRASAEEASRLARQLPGLTDIDVMGLSRFEVAARLGTGIGASVAVVTGRTEPLPPPTGMARAIRDASAARYGTSPESAPTVSNQATGEDADGSLGRGGRQL